MSRAAAGVLAALVAWAASSSASAQDTARWGHVLRAYVWGGRVDYAALAHDTATRAELDAYVASLATMSDTAPLGAWIDAYNALVLQGVVAVYPVSGVCDIPGFFDRARHAVAGRERTLDQLENEILRERFRDARVHAALVCGARSCPALSRTPYAARPIDAALDEAVHGWLGDARAVRITSTEVWLSSILDWFQADFARDGTSLMGWLEAHDARFTPAARVLPVRFIAYDWSLNAL